LALGLLVPALLVGQGAGAATDIVEPRQLSIATSQDTEVRASNPASAYGTKTVLAVDGDPVRQTFLKFEVSGIGDSSVDRVRLRMHLLDSSSMGGRVFAMSSTSWQESITWNTRPAIDGAHLASFGRVSSGSWYELDLPVSAVDGDGTVSLAVDSSIANGAKWSSRESGNAPTLLLDLDVPATSDAALTQVAPPGEGSSDPTFYGSNHRLAETSSGRLLAVYGLHASGVRLAWKDPRSPWSTATTGSITDGRLLSGTGTGDWPASIVVATAAGGEEFAVVVWSGINFGHTRPLQMRVLTNLDEPGGPEVGPVVTLAAPALGAARADVGVELGPAGEPRVLVSWTERTSDSTYALMAAWLDDHLAATPQLVSPTVLLHDKFASKSATVATTPLGVRVAARATQGRLRVFGHDQDAGLSTWWSTQAGQLTPTGAHPSAVGLASGEVLVAATRDLVQGVVTVQRFSGPGTAPTVELEITGYAEPSLAADGPGVRLVAVRSADGYVISRYGSDSNDWEQVDRVAIGAEGGGNHSWPSTLGAPDGGVRFIVRGPGLTQDRTSVLAYNDPRPGSS
jgi:hypothetical protein